MALDGSLEHSAERVVHDGASQSRQTLEHVAEALAGLKFGQVTITVQDGIVVQIDRLERTRLKRRGS